MKGPAIGRPFPMCALEALVPGMVGVTGEDGLGAVELLRGNDEREFVGQSHGSPKLSRRFAFASGRSGPAVGGADREDQDGSFRHRQRGHLCQARGKLFRRKRLSGVSRRE